MKVQGQTPVDQTQNPHGIDKYTKLLLHMEGDDNGTTFRDECGRTMVANGGAKTENTLRRFGTTSLYMDGTGDYLSASGTIDFGTSDFTIDAWVNPTDFGQLMSIYSGGTSASNYFDYFLNTNKRIYIYCNIGGFLAGCYSEIMTMTAGTWYHLAVVRSGSTCLMFQNGRSMSVTISPAFSGSLSPTGSTYIGTDTFCGGNDSKGYYDEVRVSSGIARWTQNFIPPSRPYGGYAVKDGEMV